MQNCCDRYRGHREDCPRVLAKQIKITSCRRCEGRGGLVGKECPECLGTGEVVPRDFQGRDGAQYIVCICGYRFESSKARTNQSRTYAYCLSCGAAISLTRDSEVVRNPLGSPSLQHEDYVEAMTRKRSPSKELFTVFSIRNHGEEKTEEHFDDRKRAMVAIDKRLEEGCVEVRLITWGVRLNDLHHK